MGRIYIIAPANLATGGPELCHQLADTLNRESKRAFIVYYPFTRPHDTPAPYRHYTTHTAHIDDVEPGSTVVLPEVYGHLISDFPGCDVYFWWMSVANFYRSAGEDAAAQLHAMRRHVGRHLYQSEYARRHLADLSLRPVARLSDHLSEGYLQAFADCRPRENVVVYNPTKGMDRTELVLRALARRVDPPEAVPVKGMARDQVRELLGRAKVYIDFGGHPGKDRLPREAAACGACVLTNRRGSAANPMDVPIPAEFKINDRKPGFEQRAASKIRMLVADFDQQTRKFDAYRKVIAQEPEGFQADVATVFPSEAVDV